MSEPLFQTSFCFCRTYSWASYIFNVCTLDMDRQWRQSRWWRQWQQWWVNLFLYWWAHWSKWRWDFRLIDSSAGSCRRRYQQGPLSTPSQYRPTHTHTHHACTAIRCTEDVLSYSVAGLIKNYHPNWSMWIDGGENIVQEVDHTDPLSQEHIESKNVYYPFASNGEWELAWWLLSSSLSQSSVNKFLHPEWVCLILLLIKLCLNITLGSVVSSS